MLPQQQQTSDACVGKLIKYSVRKVNIEGNGDVGIVVITHVWLRWLTCGMILITYVICVEYRIMVADGIGFFAINTELADSCVFNHYAAAGVIMRLE